MSAPMLQVTDLRGGYGAVDVLGGVSLQVAQGAVVALIGANGAGKTTAMRLISGLLKPTGGTILLDGRPVQGLDACRIARLGLAHAPEGRKVFGPLSTEDNLLLGAYTWLPRFLGFRGAAAADLEAAYDRFPRLRERRRQQAGTLSGGEQQMLATGRALMTRPRLLLMDEPSMGLAPVLVEAIFDVIKAINAEGTTILLVEQNALMALSIAHRGYVIQTGQIVLQDTAANLKKNEMVRKSYLGME